MRLNSTYIDRIAKLILADSREEWVSKQEYPRPPRKWGSDVHETSLGWGRGKEVKPEPNQNVPRGTNQEVVPRWVKDKDFVSKMAKQRPDLNAEKIYEELKGYPDSKSRKLALHWTLTKGIVSPEEDREIVFRAIKVADLKKVDPTKYKSPLEITETYGGEVKADRINPATIKEFSNKKELPEGVTYYDVEDNKEGQLAVRKIMDTHFGEDSNPWCLAYKEGDTPTSQAWTHWSETYNGPKKIAFQNGKLISLFAGGEWWDKLNNSTFGIPITAKIPNDKLGRKVLVEMDSDSGEVGATPTKVFKGDPNNGAYAEWYPDTKEKYGDYLLSESGIKKNGVWDGEHTTFYANKNNTKQYEVTYKNNIPIGPFKSYWDSGELKTVGNYSDKSWLQYRKVGKHETYYKNGSLEKRETLSADGLEIPIGEYEEYSENGKLKEKGLFDLEGKSTRLGERKLYNDRDIPFEIIRYDNGEIVGKTCLKNGVTREWTNEEIATLNRVLKMMPNVPDLEKIVDPDSIKDIELLFNKYKK